MLFTLSHIETYLLVIFSSAVLSLLTIPSILFVSQQRGLYDDQHLHRKAHANQISRLGGVGIFCSFMITILLLIPQTPDLNLRYLLTACIIIFAMGIKDDIVSVNARTKFGCQILAAALLVVPGEVRLTGLYGLMGIDQISPPGQVFLSMLFIIMLINAFNLIDGINCLAAGTGLLASLVFGILFWLMDQPVHACISFALAGALTGFIPYNIRPAKLFLGDTGAMLIGLVLSIVSIEFINNTEQLVNMGTAASGVPVKYVPVSGIALAIAILILPVFDTLRVFTVRILRGRSPFHADRTHIHHLLLRTGLSHERAAMVLLAFNGMAILSVIVLDGLGNLPIIGMLLFYSLAFISCVQLLLLRSRQKKTPKSETQALSARPHTQFTTP